MKKIHVYTILVLGVSFSCGFGVSRFVNIILQDFDVWPPTNTFLTVFASICFLMLTLAFAYSVKAIKGFDKPRYIQSFVSGFLVAIPLFWLLFCLEEFFKQNSRF